MSESVQATTGVPQGADGEALVDRGRSLYRQGDLSGAQRLLHQAYEAYKQSEDQGGVAEAANDLGVLLTAQRQYGEAETWLRDAQRRFADLRDYDGEAQTLGNLGSMYQARGELVQAAAHLKQAADLFRLVGGHEDRAATLKTLSVVRLRQLRFLEALAAYDAALACYPQPSLLQRLLRRLFGLPLRLLQR
jgi:tetratricopeptide (TPR) repeat protein